LSLKQLHTSVLLVDDDAILREAVAVGLEEFGYDVLTADDGESAQAVVLGGARVDVVVTDVVMPKMSGPQFVTWLAGRIPSIFVTGYADDVLIRHGLANPQTDFLHKPYSIAQLHQKIVEVLSRQIQAEALHATAG
jgi:CheY-like chemotaxis protein